MQRKLKLTSDIAPEIIGFRLDEESRKTLAGRTQRAGATSPHALAKGYVLQALGHGDPLHGIESGVSKIEDTITALQAQLSQVASKEEVSKVNNRVTELEEGVRSIMAGLTQIYDEVPRQEQISGLAENIQTLATAIHALRVDVAQSVEALLMSGGRTEENDAKRWVNKHLRNR